MVVMVLLMVMVITAVVAYMKRVMQRDAGNKHECRGTDNTHTYALTHAHEISCDGLEEA